ncbi:hypothetical protein EVAR_14418_1 [Eumeta japonica]|uniref:Uncharacterized protein n=1 Tax=Eumeta variegata TaxID=151549 RepID=A0A4C1TXJ4_EUMVA|nr:hypothetical protein EVAR_14418_1 [Eumeta japonica]
MLPLWRSASREVGELVKTVVTIMMTTSSTNSLMCFRSVYIQCGDIEGLECECTWIKTWLGIKKGTTLGIESRIGNRIESMVERYNKMNAFIPTYTGRNEGGS